MGQVSILLHNNACLLCTCYRQQYLGPERFNSILLIGTRPRPVPHKCVEITGTEIGVYGTEFGLKVFEVSVFQRKPELGKVFGIQL